MKQEERSTKHRPEEQRSRGQIVPRGTKKYLLRIYLGRGTDGRRKYSSKTIDGNYRAAEQALTKMLHAVDTGTHVEPGSKTVAELLAEWLESKRSLSYAARTSYGSLIDKQIIPELGHLRLDKLTRTHVAALVTSLVSQGKSPRTIQYSITVLKMALKKAVEWNFILRNPAEGVETPRKVRRPSTVMSPDQAAGFLQTSQGERLYPLWVLLLSTGLRPEEAYALTWADLDLTTNTVTISKALQLVGPGKYESLGTKTEKSRRTVSFGKDCTEALESWRKASLREQLELGFRTDLVFHNTVGRYVEANAVRAAWKASLKSAGLSADIRLYDCRHTHLTHLMMLGFSPKVAADRAGHSNISITLDTYSHVMPGLDKQAGDSAGSLLFQKAK